MALVGIDGRTSCTPVTTVGTGAVCAWCVCSAITPIQDRALCITASLFIAAIALFISASQTARRPTNALASSVIVNTGRRHATSPLGWCRLMVLASNASFAFDGRSTCTSCPPSFVDASLILPRTRRATTPSTGSTSGSSSPQGVEGTARTSSTPSLIAVVAGLVVCRYTSTPLAPGLEVGKDDRVVAKT